MSGSAPTVRVRLFGSLREMAGWSERWVSPTAAHPTPLALWDQLGLMGGWQEAPPGSDLPRGVRVAINQQFASPRASLASGDELAFLPPITGG